MIIIAAVLVVPLREQRRGGEQGRRESLPLSPPLPCPALPCYLLLTVPTGTYYLLPTTYYLLPTTYYLLRSAWKGPPEGADIDMDALD